MKFKKGFSLIELMIVIAIIGILASIAVPSYNTYIKKAQIVEVISLLDSAMPLLIESHQSKGSCPSAISLAGVTLPGGSTYISAANGPASIQTLWYNACINVASTSCTCQVAAKVSPTLGGGAISLVLIPQTDGSYKKVCGIWFSGEAGTTAPYLPSSCSNVNLQNTN